ncbi:hypothetical protein FOYG_16979 [Fusarium oxysporum NRRL 32931]|uniref:Uncharacterized protein n=1 Tax=Fusarium oxysporum NRRL 32931 TaxID=660029 RepID=W9HG33_FUSOX|nr:hypothetical protein FOYG_16979 [Fusarium oxysporum NRRL 32931]
MSDKYLPGHEGFWIYFVTALPLLTCVFFLSVGYQQIEGICKQICAAFITGSRRTPKRPAPQTGEA